ncbi:hypothetical protein LX64_01428 [Chitinophaga skermanii]|uniref:Self-protective colicin-like immunity protein n=1 Tax=Chitinophaga skermanii TaxID=331697 RepID=A0A327QYH8_9BACT|nr:hypothetical protein [Chitinophaga skermanii]RAJ08774.1 hypothetical protein LX64_01428 [Chitinophaga skermanii]
MDERFFFKVYLNALENALKNDHHNYGYLVKSPDFYMDSETMHEIDRFIEEALPNREFIDFVEEYFDAKSHNFPDVGKMDIDDARKYIIDEIGKLKMKYAL